MGRKDAPSDDSSSTRLVKDSANLRKEKVYSLSDVRKSLNTLSDEVGKIGRKGNFTQSDVKELFRALDIKDLEGQDKAVSDYVERLSEQSFEVDGTIVSRVFTDEQKAELKQRLTDLLKATGKPSEMNKAIQMYHRTAADLRAEISRWKSKADNRVDFAKKLQTLRNSEDKLKKGQTPAGQVVVGPLGIFSEAYKAMRLVKRDYGVGKETFQGVYDAMKGYTQDLFDNRPDLPYLYDPVLRAKADTIGEYLEALKDPTTAKEKLADLLESASTAMTDIAGRIAKSISGANDKYVDDLKAEMAFSNESMNLFEKSTKGKNISNIVAKVLNNSISTEEVLLTYLHPDDKIVKIFGPNARKAQSEMYLMQFSIQDEFGRGQFKKLGVKEKYFLRKMKTRVGGNVITANEALTLYVYSKSPFVLDEMLGYGLKIEDAKNGQTHTVKLEQGDLDSLFEELSPELKSWGDLVYEKFFNDYAQKTIASDYEKFTGGTIRMEEDYVPIRRGDLGSKTMEDSAGNFALKYMDGLDQPFLKRRTNSHNPIAIESFTSLFDAYAHALSVFSKETPFMKEFDALNTKFGTKSVMSQIRNLIPEGGKFVDFFVKNFLGQPVGPNDGILMKLTGNAVTSVLGANPSSAMKQPISMLKIPLVTGWKAFFYGFFHQYTSIFRPQTTQLIASKSGEMRQRWSVGGAIQARNLLQKTGRVARIFGWLMEQMDKSVITGISFQSALYRAQELGFGKIGTEENLDAAIQILEEIVVKTQSNANRLDMSRIRGGDLGTATKIMFGMFASDNQKTLEMVNSATRKVKYAKERLAHYEEMYEHFREKISEQDEVLKDPNATPREKAEAQEKKKNYERADEEFHKREAKDKEFVSPKASAKRLAFAIGTLLASAALSAAVTALFNLLKGKEFKEQDMLKDFAGDFLGWIPYAGTIANSILNNQDSLNAGGLNSLNDLLSLSIQFFNTASEGTWSKDYTKLIYKGISSLGSLTGFPLKNFIDYSSGIAKLVGGEGGNAYYYLSHGYDGSVMVSRMKGDLDAGNLSSATSTLSANMALYKTGSASWDLNREIARLYGKKLTVLPKDFMTEYKNEDGETVPLTETQQEVFRRIYKKANGVAEKLLRSKGYKDLSDEERAKTLKRIFDAFYDAAKAITLKIEASSKLGRILAMTGGDVDLANVVMLMKQIDGVEAGGNRTRAQNSVLALNRSTVGGDRGEKLLSLWLSGISLADNAKGYLQSWLVRMGADKSIVARTIV